MSPNLLLLYKTKVAIKFIKKKKKKKKKKLLGGKIGLVLKQSNLKLSFDYAVVDMLKTDG